MPNQAGGLLHLCCRVSAIRPPEDVVVQGLCSQFDECDPMLAEVVQNLWRDVVGAGGELDAADGAAFQIWGGNVQIRVLFRYGHAREAAAEKGDADVTVIGNGQQVLADGFVRFRRGGNVRLSGDGKLVAIGASVGTRPLWDEDGNDAVPGCHTAIGVASDTGGWSPECRGRERHRSGHGRWRPP